MSIIITEESIYSKDALRMMEDLSKELFLITGNDGCSSFETSDWDHPRSIFVMAREYGTPVGCGSFRGLTENTAELKRIYAAKKSVAIGRQILNYLEEKAREYQYDRLVLSTRSCNSYALLFYQKYNYQIISSYGNYKNRPESICLEKILK